MANVTYGNPPDDPTCILQWKEHLPDPALFPSPRPFAILMHPGEFKGGGIEAPNQRDAAIDLAKAGFIAVSITYRLAFLTEDNRLPGQTTNGKWPQQTADCKIAVRAARADPRCNGKVVAVGGSAGATHAFSLASEDETTPYWTPADRVSAAVCLSGAYKFDERSPDPNLGTLINAVTNYTGTTDLAALLNVSPVTLVDATVKPVFLVSSLQDPMPYQQFASMVARLTALRVSFRSEGSINNAEHAFAHWPVVRDTAIPWLLEAVGADVGGGGTLLPYTAWVTSPVPGATGFVPDIPGTATSVTLTGLAPETPYRFNLQARSEDGGEGSSVAGIDLLTLPIETGGGGGGGGGGTGLLKEAPKGIYAVLPMAGDIVPGLDALGLWSLDYIDGSRWTTKWSLMQPDQASFLFDPVVQYLDLSRSRGKGAGLQVSVGANSPTWIYSKGAVPLSMSGPPLAATIPVPWDLAYLKYLRQFLQQLGLRFDSHPALRYFIVSLGRISSTILASSYPDVATLDSVTVPPLNIVTSWLPVVRTLLGNYTNTFPTTRLFISLDLPVPNTYSYTGNNALTAIVGYASGRPGSQLEIQYGYMNESLTDTSDNSTLPFSIIAAKKGTSPTGFKFLNPSAGNSTLFNNTLNKGISLGGDFIEIYDADAENLTPPYPANIIAAREKLI